MSKVKLKLSYDILANFIKHFNHLIAFTSVHRPYCFTLPTSVSVSLWSKISEDMFFFSGCSCTETLLWQKRLIPAPFYLKGISLLLISATLLYHSTIPWCVCAVEEETSEPETCHYLRWNLYCYSSPNHLMRENVVTQSAFCLSFVFFVSAF